VTPCNECLLIPICKHKSFQRLVDDCRLLRDTLYKEGTSGVTISNRKKDFKNNVEETMNVINTDEWWLFQDQTHRELLVMGLAVKIKRGDD
jgi:hypothetical protein